MNGHVNIEQTNGVDPELGCVIFLDLDLIMISLVNSKLNNERHERMYKRE